MVHHIRFKEVYMLYAAQNNLHYVHVKLSDRNKTMRKKTIFLFTIRKQQLSCINFKYVLSVGGLNIATEEQCLLPLQ